MKKWFYVYKKVRHCAFVYSKFTAELTCQYDMVLSLEEVADGQLCFRHRQSRVKRISESVLIGMY